MTRHQEARDCPFCGKPVGEIQAHEAGGPGFWEGWASCSECGAQGPLADRYSESGPGAAVALAIELWERRPPSKAERCLVHLNKELADQKAEALRFIDRLNDELNEALGKWYAARDLIEKLEQRGKTPSAN